MIFRNGYNYDSDKASLESGLVCHSATRTHQSFRDECDINNLVKKFARTGIPPAPENIPEHADFDAIFDFHSAMNEVVRGREAFMQLPALVREKFRNDPGNFLNFVADEKNLAEAENLGLVPRGTLEARLTEKIIAAKAAEKKLDTSAEDGVVSL